MNSREFTYLKEVDKYRKEVSRLEQEMEDCQQEFDNLLINEKGQPHSVAHITDKMTVINSQLESYLEKIHTLNLMLSN